MSFDTEEQTWNKSISNICYWRIITYYNNLLQGQLNSVVELQGLDHWGVVVFGYLQVVVNQYVFGMITIQGHLMTTIQLDVFYLQQSLLEKWKRIEQTVCWGDPRQLEADVGVYEEILRGLNSQSHLSDHCEQQHWNRQLFHHQDLE